MGSGEGLDEAEHVHHEEDGEGGREGHHGRQAPRHGTAVPRVTRQATG